MKDYLGVSASPTGGSEDGLLDIDTNTPEGEAMSPTIFYIDAFRSDLGRVAKSRSRLDDPTPEIYPFHDEVKTTSVLNLDRSKDSFAALSIIEARISELNRDVETMISDGYAPLDAIHIAMSTALKNIQEDSAYLQNIDVAPISSLIIGLIEAIPKIQYIRTHQIPTEHELIQFVSYAAFDAMNRILANDLDFIDALKMTADNRNCDADGHIQRHQLRPQELYSRIDVDGQNPDSLFKMHLFSDIASPTTASDLTLKRHALFNSTFAELATAHWIPSVARNEKKKNMKSIIPTNEELLHD